MAEKNIQVRKLHPTQTEVLRVLSAGMVGKSMSDICTAMGRTTWDGKPNNTIRGCVSRLIGRGYIRQDGGSPRYYYITDLGRNVLYAQ